MEFLRANAPRTAKYTAVAALCLLVVLPMHWAEALTQMRVALGNLALLSWDTATDRYLALYAELIGTRQSKHAALGAATASSSAAARSSVALQ